MSTDAREEMGTVPDKPDKPEQDSEKPQQPAWSFQDPHQHEKVEGKVSQDGTTLPAGG